MIDPLLIDLTKHAIDRYRERVKPAFSLKQAEEDLRRLLAFAVEVPEPDWIVGQRPADAWLLIGDEIALPMYRTPNGWSAVSCLTFGMLDEEGATRRHERNRRRKHRALRREQYQRTDRPSGSRYEKFLADIGRAA